MSEQTLDAVRLDIACGKRKQPGFLGVDIWEGADLACNLEQYPWPFDDNSVDEIYCSHYIEHVPDLVSFANELYRIMKPRAKATIIAPYYSSVRAWQDPTHVRAISECTFLYFNRYWREREKLDHYPITADFEFSIEYRYEKEWHGKEPEELEFARKHYINVAADIKVELTKMDPNDALTILVKAQRLWSEGKHEKAFDLCSEMIKSGIQHPDVYVMLGEYRLKNKTYQLAETMFRKVIEVDGQSYQGHLGLLRTLIESGRDDVAAEHLSELKAAFPEFASEIEELLLC